MKALEVIESVILGVVGAIVLMIVIAAIVIGFDRLVPSVGDTAAEYIGQVIWESVEDDILGDSKLIKCDDGYMYYDAEYDFMGYLDENGNATIYTNAIDTSDYLH